MPDSTPTLHLFGIRHHGPGSARSLLQALEQAPPDILLIEGPPEANDLIPLVGRADMQPPVALLVYVPDVPQRAGFYPFALFSPEWQAMQYGVRRGIPVHFMDLPQSNWMALLEAQSTPDGKPSDMPPQVPDEGAQKAAPDTAQEAQSAGPPESPFDTLAYAAGWEDGEDWWEQMVEERGGEADVFAAILEAMAALREGAPPHGPLEPLREAAMRRTIRRALVQGRKEGLERIAVVCGAWHAPALADMPPASADTATLKGLPRTKVAVTWVPWTYGHLARASGYGAGITSPGWYEHLWTTPQQTTVRWLGRVAQLLREQDMNASAAQVIDAVRLAEALAALRGRARPGLDELNEATQAVFCMGDTLPLALIRERLIVGDRLGQVAGSVTAVPLQQDLAATQRRLRFPPEAEARPVDLDLRQSNDLARSHLLHRLNLLGIPWGREQQARGQRGTFHELWTVQWEPAFAVAVIEAAVWGNTVVEAATARARHEAESAVDLAAVTSLLEQVLLADLDQAVGDVVRCLQAKTALSGDVTSLMQALPPLVRAQRYGSVRQDAGTAALDAAELGRVVDGLAERICIGLPLACASLDDDAARQMLERIEEVQTALNLVQKEALREEWQNTLSKLADQAGLHGLLAGRCCRTLYDLGHFSPDEVARRLRWALSPANEAMHSAAWLEGLLRGSGLLLLHDETLWAILDEWVATLPGDVFRAVLPLLRRTFSAFPAPERRQMGERARRGPGQPDGQGRGAFEIDRARADSVLPTLARLLGLEYRGGEP